MYTHTTFISKRIAESISAEEHHPRALISITSPATTPGCAPANLVPNAWNDVLRLEFHDYDPQSYRIRREKVPIILFNENHAVKILEFIKKHENTDVSHLIVHCEAGISRSAAVSKFIAQIYNLQFIEQYPLYNKHVFSTLLNVYGTSLYGEGPLQVDDLPGICK